MDKYGRQRQRMVEKQLEDRGIADRRVLAAMAKIPREKFVLAGYRSQAYADHPLLIGAGQTISQPYVVALTCELLELSGSEKVLEVGAGSGYQAAVLSELAKEVFAIEVIPELAKKASANLTKAGIKKVRIVVGDGKKGLPAKAPFEAIVSAAAAGEIPTAWKNQLVEGGRIVTPIKKGFGQKLVRLTKTKGKFKKEDLGGVAFVPLV